MTSTIVNSGDVFECSSTETPDVHAILGEKVACAAVSPNSYILSYTHVQCFSPLRQVHFDFGNFNSGVCVAMKMTTAESNPDTGPSTQQTVCFCPDPPARGNKIPIRTMPIASIGAVQ